MAILSLMTQGETRPLHIRTTIGQLSNQLRDKVLYQPDRWLCTSLGIKTWVEYWAHHKTWQYGWFRLVWWKENGSTIWEYKEKHPCWKNSRRYNYLFTHPSNNKWQFHNDQVLLPRKSPEKKCTYLSATPHLQHGTDDFVFHFPYNPISFSWSLGWYADFDFYILFQIPVNIMVWSMIVWKWWVRMAFGWIVIGISISVEFICLTKTDLPAP